MYITIVFEDEIVLEIPLNIGIEINIHLYKIAIQN